MAVKDRWNAIWNTTHTARLLHSILPTPHNFPSFSALPRPDQTAINALAANRACLNHLRFLYKLVPSPNCLRCSVTEDTSHFLLSCTRYVAQRAKLAHLLASFDLHLSVANLLGLAPISDTNKMVIFSGLRTYIETTVTYKNLLHLNP